MRLRHIFPFALIAGIWGTTWLAVKVVVEEMPPVSTAGARFALAALLLAVYARWRGRPLSWERWKTGERWLVLFLSFSMIAVPYALIFVGEQWISSALAAILFTTHSAWVIAFDSLHARGYVVGRARLLGLALAFLGVVIIFWPKLQGPPGEVKGVVALLAAAASSALSTVLAKHYGHHVEPVASTTWQMGAAAVWLLAVGWVMERPALSGYSVGALTALVYLAVFGSCVTFVLYYGLLKHLAPVQLSSLSFIIPLIATLAGWLVLDERLGAYSLAGAVAVVLGVAVLQRPEPVGRAREEEKPEPLPAGD